MEIIRISLEKKAKLDGITLCLGYFDALHLGHVSLIKKAKSLTDKIALLTMDPNPSSFFQKNVKEVNSIDDKIEILESLGVDYFVILETDENLLKIDSQRFIEEILLPLKVKNIVCGFDYHFGSKRSGDANLLKQYSEFNTYVCEEVSFENEKVSTTLIKNLLDEGNIEKVNKLLTRNYQIKGKVIHGNSLGNKIGFPTANIQLDENKVYPKNGVYSGYLLLENKKYLSMINIGVHPTINKLEKRIVEVHVINQNISLYDKDITLVFEKFIREEIKFESIKDLIKQLEKDKKNILTINNE